MKSLKQPGTNKRESQFKANLLARGFLTEITPRLPRSARRKKRSPQAVQNNSVSKLVIEERR